MYPCSAPFAPAYDPIPLGRQTPSDPKSTIAPPGRRSDEASASTSRTAVRTFMSNAVCHTRAISVRESSELPYGPLPPAAATTASSGRPSSVMCAATASAPRGVERSAARVVMAPSGPAERVRSSASTRRPTMRTVLPSAARRRAAARPMPLPPPLTTTRPIRGYSRPRSGRPASAPAPASAGAGRRRRADP